MRNKVIIQVAFLLLSISGFARISPSISAVSKQSSGILFTQTDNSTVYLPCQSVSAIVQSGGSSNTITVYYANEQSSIKTLAFDYTVTGFSTKQQVVDSLYEWSSCDTSGGGGVSQTLSISGDTLSISGGNSVVLPVYVQVDSAIITSYDVLNSQNAPPGSPATGDIYLVGNSPSGAWVGHAKDVAEWNGSAWVFTDGVQGDFLYNATTALTYIFRSGNWVQTTGIPALNNGNTISSGLTIGTNNARSLNFETNNINRGRFDSIGRFHVYDTSLRKSNKYLQIDSITGRLVASEISGGAGSSTVALDKITDATDTSTIDNANYKQEWQWNTHVSGSAFKLSTNLTSVHYPVAGSAVFEANLSNSANPSFSGTNYAAKFINSYYSIGGSNTAIAGYFETGNPSGVANSAVYAKGNIRIEASTGRLFFGQYARIYGQSGEISFTPGTAFNNDAGSYSYGMEAGNTVRVIRNYSSQLYYNQQTSYLYKDISTSRQLIAFGVDADLSTTAGVGTSYGWIERSADKLMFAAQAGLSSRTAITPNYLLTLYGTNNNVGIGTTTPSASSALEVTSTTKFFTPPRMTSTQRDAVASPKAGDSLFCTDCTATDTTTGVMQTYNGSTWKNNW